MKRICMGTMINLFYQSRIRSTDTIKDICDGIFAAYGHSVGDYNKELPSHLKSGHDPVPGGLIEDARKLPMEEIDKGFDLYVIPLIHNDKHEAILRAIKSILKDDTTIPEAALVGKTAGFEKKRILESDTFDESALLANVTTYAIISTENDKLKSNIKEIGKNFIDDFTKNDEPIHFITDVVDQDEYTPLKRTLKDPMFDRIFNRATDITIVGMKNPAKASVFYIDPNNCRFRFRDLKDFIINNIGNYVFSRAQTKRIYDRTNNQAAIGSQAMLKFVQKYGSSAETVLGEILLYVFMEQELDAPKIMSRIEIDEYNRNTISKSDGVHLLSIRHSGQLFHQLVFGASDIIGDLNAAVDRAFQKIQAIEENSEEELRMIESTTQWTIYDPEATKYMVDLMTPKRGGSARPDMAFGAFLGYTMKLDKPETDSRKFRSAVKEQLLKDINAIQPHIADLIRQNNMSGYSFYFYVMPFNDALNEKTSIIKEMLSGGGA